MTVKVMAKEILILLCLLAFSTSSVIQPYDLVEEAEKELQQLIAMVQRRILTADDDILDIYYDFRDHSRDEAYDADRAIRVELQTINAQISQIKLLAQSAGKDVSSCTSTREEAIQQLATNYNEEIDTCVGHILAQGLQLSRDARYHVDIIMNKVHSLENQFKSCNGNLLCISPLLTQIQLYQISLIQDIREEINAVERLLIALKSSAKTCADQGVSSYVVGANAILRDLTACVDAILG